MPTHPETMDILWKLVDLDAQLVRNSREEQAARAEIAKAEAAVETARKAHIAALAVVNKARAEQKAAEQDLKAHEDRLRRLESGEMKHNPEAVEKERRAIDELETRGLELLDNVQRGETEVLKAMQALEALKSSFDAVRTAGEAKLFALRAVIDALKQSRAATSAPVAPPIMEVYESANRANPGEGLCRIKDRLCGGCGEELTLQHAVQVKGRNEIMRCPSCARIHDAPLISAA